MSVRPEVEDLVRAGRLPNEDAPVDDVVRAQRLLEAVVAPVSDDEAQALLSVFGPDDCFGLSWTLVHLIETAPNSSTADYSAHADDEWVQLLLQRRAVAEERDAQPSRE